MLSVPIEKEVTKMDKDVNEIVLTISYKIKFIWSARLMATSLSKLVDNLTQENYIIRYKECNRFLEFENAK